MVMQAQARPWTTTAGRELADANGNVVQYSVETLGQICLAVNAYERLIGALAALDNWFGADPAGRDSEADMRAAIQLAMGRIGCEQLASMIEALAAPSPDVDRRVATELSIPEAAYTTSTDAAMTLIPKSWRYSVGNAEQLDPVTGAMLTIHTIEIRSPEGQVFNGSNRSFACAIAAASVRAQDHARG